MSDTGPQDSGPWGRRDGQGVPPQDASEPVVQTVSPAPPERETTKAKAKAKARVTLLLSTLLMVGFLWLLTGSWVVAASLMFGLFVHEYGHVLAMNRLGMGPATIHVIPFLGGLAKGKREPASEWIGVLVALAGPVFGLLAMIPLVVAGVVMGDKAWLLAAVFVAMLNLVNLVPAPPLDGSRALGPVLARVHPGLEKAVLVLIGAAVVVWGLMTGRYILAVFLGIAVIGNLKSVGFRSFTGPLTTAGAWKSLGLYGASLVLCGAAAIGSMMLLTDGNLLGAFDIMGRYLGIGR